MFQSTACGQIKIAEAGARRATAEGAGEFVFGSGVGGNCGVIFPGCRLT